MSEEEAANPLASRTLCGPFDLHFKRKFFGSRSSSLLAQRNHLIKPPAFVPPSASAALLPKIRQIENIARAGGRKKVQKGKQQEVISQLELYLTKKLVSNQSTKQLITRMEATTVKDGFNGMAIRDKNGRIYSQTSSKFYQSDQKPHPQEQNSAGRTTYSPKKWISDKQFREKFDKFVLKRHQEQETVRLNEFFGSGHLESSEQIRSKIQSDKGTLKQIVKKMIERHNYESQPEEEYPMVISAGQSELTPTKERRNIRWIIQKCQDFQKYNLKKKHSKKK